jgi:GNAT superfamily N-acetyltransferase
MMMVFQLPSGFTARPAAQADLQVVVDVMNAVTQADVGKRDNTPFTVGRYWEGGDLNLSTDTVLIFAPDGQAAGFAQFIEETPPTPYDVDTWVHPTYAETEVGAALLQWVDRRAEQALSSAPAGVPASIEHIYVYAQNRSAQQRLAQAGYTHERTFYRMEIVFNGPPPEPQLPPGISIRSFRWGEEDRAVYEAFEDAQADEWGHEWAPFDKWHHYFIDVEEQFDPAAWFLAVEGETIVGYALCRWERAGEPDRSTVRYVAVRKPWRKRGIALALLHAAFGGIYRHGKRGAGLGVDATSYTGADRLYVRAGMRRAFETLRYRKVMRET